MIDVVEIDAATGEVAERNYTSDEAAQRETDLAAVVAANTARQAAEEQAAAARETALEKLAALGLTRDDLTALGL